MFLLPTGRVQAVENHNLSWGVEVGDRFDYHFAIRYSASSSNRDYYYYVEVDSLPTIPINVTDNPIITSSVANEFNTYFSFYFLNDTEITNLIVQWSAYPKGNWSLIQELSLTALNVTEDEADIFDTDTEWGMTMSIDESLGVHTDTVRYSKSDGALNLLEMNWQYYDGTYRIFRTTRSTGSTVIPFLIGIGVATLAIILVLVVIIKKR